MNNEIKLGLKGQLSYTLHNYSSVRAILRNIKWELKYAWNRAWNGYDDADVFGFDESFRERMIVCLDRLEKTRHCLFIVPEEYKYQFCNTDEDNDLKYFTDEQTSVIIQTIIFHLKMSDEDYVEKKLYGENIYDEDYTWMNTRSDFLRIESVRKQNQDMAFDLLKMFWDQLWD